MGREKRVREIKELRLILRFFVEIIGVIMLLLMEEILRV